MWLTRAETAEILRVHEITVDRYIKRGLLNAMKNPGPNGHVRIAKASLDAYIASRAVPVKAGA
jgi:excisionase family DNA binding protein